MKDFVSNGMKKVAIIGVGFVGSSIAYALAIRTLPCEIVLIDADRVKAEGEAEDIQHGIPAMGLSSVRAGDYADCADCDLIIITAGRNRRPGETRLNLIDDNSAIMRSVVDQIKPHYTRGVIMVVCNPVDLMVDLCAKWMELPDGMVFGTGCLLDTSRLVQIMSGYLGLSPFAIQGFVAGEHGDSQVPVWSKMTVGGLPVAEYCESKGLPWTDEVREEIRERVKTMGGRIIKAKGKTHYGIATCVCALADAVLNDHPTLVCVSSPLKGEYGVSGVSLSVPSIIGRHGVQERIVEHWTEEELTAFRESAERVRETMAQCALNKN